MKLAKLALWQELPVLRDMARVRFSDRCIPVAVRINLNNRCHSRCTYCSFWSTKAEELSAGEWTRVVSDLGRLGTRRLSLSGGEPMLRKDLREIVDAAVRAGIKTELNSSGFLFAERREALRKLDLVKLSLDGSEPVHDRVRGREGAFRETEEGIRVLRELGVRFSFAFTMTRENLDDIPFALAYAKQHDTFVAFQPVMATEHASQSVRDVFPEAGAYRRAVKLLMRAKLADPARLRNSLGGLRHIAAWPRIRGLRCWAGRVLVMFEPNGDVVPCDRIRYGERVPNLRETDVDGALARLPRVQCGGCGFCGSVELNMLMAGRVDIVPAVLRVIG